MAPTEVQLPPRNLNVPQSPIRSLGDADKKINEMVQRYDEVYRILREYLENGLSDVSIVSPLESNGAIPVNIQDQTTQPLDFYFNTSNPANFTTLTNTQAVGDTEIELDSTTGFVDGAYIGLFCPSEDRFYFGTQLGAPVANVITLDTPLDFAFIAGDNVAPLDRELNKDGSVTTVVAQVRGGGPTSELTVDVTRIILHITDANSMDDSKFGGITGGITNGIVLRRNNGVVNNIWNLKTNGEMGQIAFDKQYDDRAPAGFFGIRMRYTLAGQDKHGVAIRLEPGDTLDLLIQDDLTSLASFRLVAEGHVVTD